MTQAVLQLHLLQFSDTLQDMQLKGIDMIRFDTERHLVAVKEMIQPFNAFQVLHAETGVRLAGFLPAFKGG